MTRFEVLMEIPTHRKGDIALGKVISWFLDNGWYVFAPISTHACPYDLVVSKLDEETKTDTVYRVQVKCNHIGHRKYEKLDDAFDLYAAYYEKYERILFVPFAAAKNSKAKSLKLLNEPPNSATPFYWWEDFLTPSVYTEMPKKKNYKSINHKIRFPASADIKRPSKIKISNKTLQKLLWKKSLVCLASELGVSDRALGKRVSKLGLIKPPAGYWQKGENNRKKIKDRYRETVKAKFYSL